MKGINCSDPANFQAMLDNSLLNWGSMQVDGKTFYGVASTGDSDLDVLRKLSDNCKKSFAEEILSFVAFAWALIMVPLDVLVLRQKKADNPF